VSKLLRHRADWRTLLWAFALLPGVAAAQYAAPALALWLLPLGLYTGFSAGVLAHNQNHRPTFRSSALNHAYACWLSVFYGHPIFAWLPTHNKNHHSYVNRPGDAIATGRYGTGNDAVRAVTYFFVAARDQAPLTRDYLAHKKSHAPRQYRRMIGQCVCTVGGHAALLVLALMLHGLRLGSTVYLSAFGAPALFSLWSMFFINFIQHIDCDAGSRYDHSRNFVSPVGNFLVFNAGLHTAHHLQPSLHWSELPAAHARIERFIRPDLKQRSIAAYCLRTYVWAAFEFGRRRVARG
jgi:fatty acid desaturase